MTKLKGIKFMDFSPFSLLLQLQKRLIWIGIYNLNE